jgi:sugar/nucleoside kinase (ribokinase family)
VVTVAVIGNTNVDLLVWPASSVPAPGVERPVESIELRVGGAAAITGATLARLGASPVVVGCVGDDRLGALALDELAHYGVDTRHVRRLPGEATGTSIAFEAPGRDRSFLICLASLAAFEPSMVPDAALQAGFVLFGGYFNLPAMRGHPTADLLQRVRAAGGTSLLDTGWDHAGWPATTKDEIRLLLPLVDIFVPNEAEAEHLSGETDPLRAARALAAVSGGWVVVKMGAAGCLAADALGQVHRASAPEVDVVDTTGAGDGFNAGLMKALSEGEAWPAALRTAVRVASAVVSKRSNDRYPTPEELSV